MVKKAVVVIAMSCCQCLHDRILGMTSYRDVTFDLTRLTSLLTSSLILKQLIPTSLVHILCRNVRRKIAKQYNLGTDLVWSKSASCSKANFFSLWYIFSCTTHVELSHGHKPHKPHSRPTIALTFVTSSAPFCTNQPSK